MAETLATNPTAEVPVQGQEAAFHKYLPIAMAAAMAVKPLRTVPALVYHNVCAGTKALLARWDDVRKLAPWLERTLVESLPEKVLAVVFAASRVRLTTVPESDIAGKEKRAAWLRNVLLLSLEACAAAGEIPSEPVEKIRKGTGWIDIAQDLVDCASQFRLHEKALAGKTPVTAAMVVEAAELGTELVALLRPAGTPAAKTPEEIEKAAEERDRLWTLVVDGYESVRRASVVLWGDEAPEHVPALQSRTAAARKAARAEEPA